MTEVCSRSVWRSTASPVGSIAVAFRAGFTQEGADEAGLAHFAEHMLLAPREDGYPYSVLEPLGYLLHAQTRRDHMTVSLTGPHSGLVDAFRVVEQHLSDVRRPSGTAVRVTSVIRNEILEKTNLRPWLNRWRWSVQCENQELGLARDPIVAPALQMRCYSDEWESFLARHASLRGSSYGVVINTELCTSSDRQWLTDISLSRTVTTPVDEVEQPLHVMAVEAEGREVVLGVTSRSANAQATALAAMRVIADTLAEDVHRPPSSIYYGLFDEWFSEQPATMVRAPLPENVSRDQVEHVLSRLESNWGMHKRYSTAVARIRREWNLRANQPNTLAKTLAWQHLGGQLLPEELGPVEAVKLPTNSRH